ncbi:PulJ/GspJ family protein [Deinococcus koreensis]|uniref:PulJ/GspJ family protein n=1 Tax=Deinococcus koreensis TaxID=2054903 RepID=UPI0013FD2877|nr:prepilin-type N-terminal cleavage/methylation domain-containing protein [Deinococcus koreensis]
MKFQSGLTLVEVLVAMAILGIILVLITNWQMQTLQLTTKTNAGAEQLVELNDLSGYIGDRVRSASSVRRTGLTVNAASAVNAGKCDTTTPCLAVLALEEKVDTSSTPPTITRKWMRLVFRMEPRATWSGADKVPDDWADDASNKVMILREYRDICTITTVPAQTCEAFKASFLDAAFSGMSPALVTDSLTSVDQSGATILPFDFTATSATVTLKFQSKRNVRGVTTFSPGAAPYTLDVQARNVPYP